MQSQYNLIFFHGSEIVLQPHFLLLGKWPQMHKDSNNEQTDHLTEQIITDDSKIRKRHRQGR